MKAIKNSLLKLLFPPYCLICGTLLPTEEWNEDRCGACRAHPPFLTGQTCPFCGRSLLTAGECPSCLKHKPVYDKGFAAFSYDVMKEEIGRFKFDGAAHDAVGLGRLMAEYWEAHHDETSSAVDCMTEVPLHRKKEHSRGFNQAALLCENLSKRTGIPYTPKVLERTRETSPQSELNAEQRRENLRDAFTAQDCSGKRMLLIDDILTTGSTVNACAKALYRAGAEEVQVFALSVTYGEEPSSIPKNIFSDTEIPE